MKFYYDICAHRGYITKSIRSNTANSVPIAKN